MVRFRLAAMSLFLTFILGAAFPIGTAASPLDFSISGGHFFSEANGRGGAGGTGYSVTDAGGIALWTQFNWLGGVDALGYPVSHRFLWNGTVVQAFQKAVLQWQPDAETASLVNIFDELAAAGKDDWLMNVYSVPRTADWSTDQGKTWDQIVQNHIALLDLSPAIKAAYFDVSDPVTAQGLPIAAEEYDTVFVIRAQRKVFQQWKEDTLWAKAGQVTIANGGDIAKEAGMIPPEAARPSPPDQPAINPQTIIPGSGSRLVAVDPGHGADEVGSAYRFFDGVVLQEKDVNLDIALRVAALLKDAGYRVVLTRDSDSSVNTQDLELNGDDEVNVRDDLQARVDIANREEADALVSIHCNGNDYSYLRGTEVYYDEDRPFSAKNLRLAETIQRSLVSSIRDAGYETVDRGIKTDVSVLQGEHFYLLGPAVEGIARPSRMPAVIGESLFLTNLGDATQLRSDTMIDAIARGYAAGISQYLATDP